MISRHLAAQYPELRLPALLLSRYLFFLIRRPISLSNTHYAQRRIHGLQSLAETLEPVEDPRVASGVRLLRSMNPTNLHETAERLQLILLPFAQAEIPRTYITAEAPPPVGFLRTARRILLVLGPAIGIGDEIITFPIPHWTKAAHPTAEITVLSAYEGLWERVSAVDRIAAYHDHLSMLRAIRGESDLGDFDLVFLIDFENPELYRAIAHETAIPKYVELSLGAQVMVAVDNRRGWIHRLTLPAVSFGNFYHGLERLATSLGMGPAGTDHFETVVRHADKSAGEEVRVYVSPFTSKYDPSLRYWSRLVTSLISPDAVRPVRFVMDPGPNLTTRSFSAELARTAAAQTLGQRTRFELASAGETRGLSLSGAFAELEQAHIVICADSFTAHAAPVMGCTTLVLASRGLENWRVPHPSSYYFDDEASFEELVAGMQQVLGHLGLARPQDVIHPPITEAEVQLMAVGHDLGRLLGNRDTGDFRALCVAYDRFVRAYCDVVRRLPHWPLAARGLLRDYAYETPPCRLDGEHPVPVELQADVTRHLQNLWLEWRNTNLSKYLDFVIEEADA